MRLFSATSCWEHSPPRRFRLQEMKQVGIVATSTLPHRGAPKRPTYSELDARKVKPPPRFEVKAPKGAPNVVIVLIDDIGFGGPSTFGGPIRTPTMDQLGAGWPAIQ